MFQSALVDGYELRSGLQVLEKTRNPNFPNDIDTTERRRFFKFVQPSRPQRNDPVELLNCPIRERQRLTLRGTGATSSRAPNDVRIDCKAAKHSDGDGGTPPADLVHRTAGGVPPASADCSSGPIGPRANKRRFGNLLQQLGATRVLLATADGLLKDGCCRCDVHCAFVSWHSASGLNKL